MHQKLYLLRRLDSDSFRVANAADGSIGSLSLGNQIHRQYRAGSANSGFAVDSHRFATCKLLVNKLNEFSRLLHGGRTAIRDRQTDKAKTRRTVNGRVTGDVEQRDNRSYPGSVKYLQIIFVGCQISSVIHSPVWVNEWHRHPGKHPRDDPPQETGLLLRVHMISSK